jgi:mannitol-1-/sugar-/sorbitol-6-/2-deoxyglucose-6-phosphatase
VRQIQAAIFDMDGLLIDTEPVWRRSEIEIFGRLGLHLTEEQCLETMGVRIAEVVRRWYSRHPWSGPAVDEVTRDVVDTVIRHVLAEGEPKPGVLNVLDVIRAAGLPIAIASSSGEELIRAVIRRLRIEPYITAICSAEDEPEGKPHPAVYLRAAAHLGVAPACCLAFEDSPNGVLSAKAAGMYCIVVPDPYLASHPRMEEADLRLASLEEFTPELLSQLQSARLARSG